MRDAPEAGHPQAVLVDLLALDGLLPGGALLVHGEPVAAALREAGCRVTTVEPGAAGAASIPAGPFDAAVLDGLPGTGTDLETLLADVVQAVRPGGPVVLRLAGDSPGAPSRDELCAHFAGEMLGVEEHREAGAAGDIRTIWLLRVPGAEPAPGGDR